jgi:uncharacterized membrane protein
VWVRLCLLDSGHCCRLLLAVLLVTYMRLLLLLLFFLHSRINSKLREKGKKEEGRRLREFVDAAYRVDPRVTARKEAQAAER